MFPPAVIERFWKKVQKAAGCWLWTAYRSRRGYGHFGVNNRVVLRAHRVSWELTNGPVPPGMEVCHRCDNPGCVRPGHLFVGTHQENMADASRKGRLSTAGTPRKLTPRSVVAIRRDRDSGMLLKALSRKYGIAESTASSVVRRQIWRRVA